ncbi:MAG: hypothetical protein U1E81_09675 [Xanthobacteraceae bacterium]
MLKVTIPRAAFGVGAIIVMGFAFSFSATAPTWDAWTWILWLRQYQAGEASLPAILIRVHNEHPYGLPSVFFITLGRLGAYECAGCPLSPRW